MERFLTEEAAKERDLTFLEAFALGRDPPLRPTIQNLERYAPQWAPLAPENPGVQAAVGRILGYALILWSLWEQRREAELTVAPIAISIATWQRPLYTVTALIALGATYLAYQRYQATQERGDRLYALAFAALLISEILFVLSMPGVYDPWWKLAHLMKLVGFAGLGVYLVKKMAPAATAA